MIVRVSARAEADLRAIGRWIARDNPRRATTFIRDIEHRIAGLETMPRRYQQLSRAGVEPSLHRFAHGRYLIYYRVGQTVEIVTVRHSARGDAAFLDDPSTG